MNSSQHTPKGLSRVERLRGRGAVSELFEGGESGFVYPIRYVWRARETTSKEEKESTPSSVLFTVPKRFHKRANKRNLLRRRIKEAYRLQKELLSEIEGFGGEIGGVNTPHLDIALIYSSKDIVEYDKISRSVAKALRQIAEEQGQQGQQGQQILEQR